MNIFGLINRRQEGLTPIGYPEQIPTTPSPDLPASAPTQPIPQIQTTSSRPRRSAPKRLSTGALWMGIIIVAAYIGAIITFAFQTWLLVDTIFPADNQFMKIGTVVCLDIMSVIFAATEMFFPFRSKGAKSLAMGMWLITFVGALLCSIIYMYLNSINVLHGVVDMSILVWAYAVVVIIMAADVLAITVGIRMEYGAHHPDEDYPVYSQQPDYSPQPQPTFGAQQTIQSPQIDMNQLLLTLLTSQLQGGMQQQSAPLARTRRKVSVESTPEA